MPLRPDVRCEEAASGQGGAWLSVFPLLISAPARSRRNQRKPADKNSPADKEQYGAKNKARARFEPVLHQVSNTAPGMVRPCRSFYSCRPRIGLDETKHR